MHVLSPGGLAFGPGGLGLFSPGGRGLTPDVQHDSSLFSKAFIFSSICLSVSNKIFNLDVGLCVIHGTIIRSLERGTCPIVYTRTKRYCSFINYALNNYQDKL